MKPISFFSKQSNQLKTKVPTDVDVLRETTLNLSQQVKMLQTALEEPKTDYTIPLQLKQLEGDFLYSQAKNQEFHESFTTTLYHLSQTIQQLDSEVREFELKNIQMKKYIRILEKRQELDNRYSKEVIDTLTKRIEVIEEALKKSQESERKPGEQEKKQVSTSFLTAKQVFELNKKDS